MKTKNGGVIMCEYCHYIAGHHHRCPNAPEPKVRGYCDQCGYELREDHEYYTDDEDNKFCAIECALKYHSIQSKEWESGILICKTGFGMTIVANKFKGIRCAPCYDEETAKQAKEHSNVNVLALPAAYLSTSKAIQIMRVWVASEFLGGRYSDRLQMIQDIEKENMK
mgnify:CR=1 FL=1